MDHFQLVIPPFLKPGDLCAIVAPSRFADESMAAKAEEVFASWGLRTVRGQNIGKRHFQFGGSDEARTEELQHMLDHPEIKAIVAIRGGYGLIRIIDKLDFSTFSEKPKWLCGFSDFTVLHQRVNVGLGIASLHCEMPVNYASCHIESTETIIELLSGRCLSASLNADCGRNGTCRGRLLGGNLSIIQSMLCSRDGLPDERFILFIEDVGEYLYHLERLLISLKRARIFERVTGLLVGGLTDMRDHTPEFGHEPTNPFGFTANEILKNVVEDYAFPYCTDLPIGHLRQNHALLLGCIAEIDIAPGNTKISYQIKNPTI